MHTTKSPARLYPNARLRTDYWLLLALGEICGLRMDAEKLATKFADYLYKIAIDIWNFKIITVENSAITLETLTIGALLVTELLIAATKDMKDIDQTREPLVLFRDFGDRALVFDVLFWSCLTGVLVRDIITSKVRYKIDE